MLLNVFNVHLRLLLIILPIIKKETNQKIVSSVIELAKKLNVKVVAEYVETEEEYSLLKHMGCDWYQGYLFSKPIPLEELINSRFLKTSTNLNN